MKRAKLVAVSALILTIALAPVSRADVKSGTKCTRIGQTTISANKKFTCTKVGATKVWNKGVALPAVGPRVTMRVTSPDLTSTGGVPNNFVDISKSTSVTKWLTNYAAGTQVSQTYAAVGEPLTISWHVTQTDTSQVAANLPVWLTVNANEGGAQRAVFTYQTKSGTQMIKANSQGRSETQIPGITDSQGDVSFILRNTNSIGEAEPTPTALNRLQPAQNTVLYSNFTLTARSSHIRERKDVVSIHFTKPSDKLLWSDEFSASGKVAPDDQTWNQETGDGCPDLCGWGNGEVEFYKESATRTDGKGHLVITTKKLSPTTTYSCYPDTCQWSSGKITTQGKTSYQYGLIEARIKVPEGGGTWPAFWMLGTSITTVPWPLSGEIDIMEAAGNEPYKISGTAHLANSRGQHIYKGDYTYTPQLTASGYHTFGVLWKPDQLDWLVDGQVFYTLQKRNVGSSPWPFNAPFYIIVNTAMGGGFGGLVSWELNSATTSIDWIRVYQNGGFGCVTTSSTSTGNCS